ncbi:RNA polymerase II-associated protein [Gautieria morchelliformis]|nr:RNA polymerase II-associated protein [Gautieria morchelliformis]
MSVTDPLIALRSAIQAKYDISYASISGEVVSSLQAATDLRLSPTLSLPKATPTRFRKPSAAALDPHTAPNDFVTLESLLVAWLARDASVAEYMKQVREAGIGAFVSITERKGVVEWLEGKVQDHERIVPLPVEEPTTPPGMPPQGSTTPKNQAGLSATPSSPLKRRYIPDTSDVDIVKKLKREEVELRDRTSVLRGIKPNNFSAIRNVVGDRLKKMKEMSKSGAVPVAAAPKPDPKMVAKKARNNFPIIIISSSPTSLITMHNVKRFLQESVFEPSSEARARAAAEGNSRADDLIPVYRRRTQVDPSGRETETRMRYFVVDGVDALKKFGDDAWDRVVCVMTTGQAWQFRPYKWPEPKQLFHHVKGVYVSWSNDPPNAKIKDWNVSEMRIDPHRRHVDKSVVAHFWKMLDTWTMTNKPWLMA